MTNTQTMPVLTADQLVAYRTDEVGFMSDLYEVANRYNVVRVGRFVPGGEVSYAAAYVLRVVGVEYVVHLMVRADDSPGPVTWSFQSGFYYRSMERALLTLAER